MSINLIAQLLTSAGCFAIFAWVVAKYFFPSILKAIEDRQHRIKAEFDRIDLLQAEVASLKADYSRRISEIEAEAREKISDAIAQGKAIAAEIEEKARQEREVENERNRQALQLEVEKLRIELKQKVVALTLSATEKVIREKISDKKHRQLVEDFVEKGLAQS